MEGTDCTKNWKSLLLRMMPAQISAMPLATVEATTARIKDVDIWPCGARTGGAAGSIGSIMRLQTVLDVSLKKTKNQQTHDRSEKAVSITGNYVPMAPIHVTLSLARTSSSSQRQMIKWVSSSRLQLCV